MALENLPLVLVACGSGIATSETVGSKLRRMLAERGVEAEVLAVGFGKVKRYINQATVYVTILPNSGQEWPCPLLNGVAFLTGMGQDEEFEKLVKILEEAGA